MSPAPETAIDDLAHARQEIEELRRQLIEERQRALHAVDAQRGAEAVASQAQADVRELQYRLHVREAELSQLQEVLERIGMGTVESGASSSTQVAVPSPATQVAEPSPSTHLVGPSVSQSTTPVHGGRGRWLVSLAVDRLGQAGSHARAGLGRLGAAAREHRHEASS